jgi:hypothetical protein
MSKNDPRYHAAQQCEHIESEIAYWSVARLQIEQHNKDRTTAITDVLNALTKLYGMIPRPPG